MTFVAVISIGAAEDVIVVRSFVINVEIQE